jgi:antitoxin HicB
MGSSLNARQQNRAGAVHSSRPHTGSPARVHQKITKNAAKRPRSRTATATRPEEEGLNPAHLGSTLEDFLREEGLFETVQVLAVKKVLAYKLLELMREEHLTKDALAKRMQTSRAALDRLLDPENPSVTLLTLGKAACALKRTLRVELA